jgi:hypothetical protein
MITDDDKDCNLHAQITIRESLEHEVLLRAEVEVVVSEEDLAMSEIDLATLSDSTLASRQARGVVGGHAFYLMRNPILFFDEDEGIDLSDHAIELDAINAFLPEMALKIASTGPGILRANDGEIPAFGFGEEDAFWHHPAFETHEILDLCMRIIGRSLSTHEPMMFVQAMARGTSSHAIMETRNLLRHFPDHSAYELGAEVEDTYLSLGTLGDYQIGFFSPGRHQRSGYVANVLREGIAATEAVFPFNPRPRT